MSLLIVYAGPNGSGKSSLRDQFVDQDMVDVVIDADQIARSICPLDPRSVDFMAGRRALEWFDTALSQHRSMSLETTLAGRSILPRLLRAKQAGYRIGVRYLGLQSVALNIERVRARAAAGGHFVSAVDVARRHASSMQNLQAAMLIADQTVLIDNSGAAFKPVLEFMNGVLVRSEADLPAWVRDTISALP